MPNCSAEEESQLIKPKTLITSFLPRQLLINPNPKSTTNMKSSTTLNKCDYSQQRGLLLKSIALFLDKNGFSKTLKYFLKEAHIQKDDGEISSLDIEEMCFEYLKSRNGAKKEPGSDQTVVESAKNVEKTKENESNGEKKSEPTTENGTIDNGDVKSKKKKKKSKSANGASEQVIEETQSKPSETPVEIPLTLPSEPAKKSKDKKKKNKDESEPLDKDLQEKQSEVAAENVEIEKEKKEKKVKKEKKESKEKDASKVIEENVTNSGGPSLSAVEAGEKKKDSKKRKKPSSEENGVVEEAAVDEKKKESKKRKKPSSEENGAVEEAAVDDSKRRKTDTSDQSNGIVQPPKTPNGSANGVFETDGTEKSQKQSKTKELNGSAEPGTAKKAFQRVKPEDVEFADERLQDNSYWAKDGADSGYGAKAQEVLGQVRGRDFRHEKTKKKRGSYRGGLIDMNTHSVKFNYEDEDE